MLVKQDSTLYPLSRTLCLLHFPQIVWLNWQKDWISFLIPEFELDQYRYPVMDRKVDGDASEAALLKFADVSLGEIMSINFIKWQYQKARSFLKQE